MGDDSFPAIELFNCSSLERVYTSVPSRLWQVGLHNPSRQFLSRSGKGIRPELVNELFRLSGGTGKAPQAISEAIELLHAGSLIVDDIEDGSKERRGRSTLHLEIGIPLALNTGNWMYFEAIDKLARSPFDPRTRHRILSVTIRTVRRCHEGQALDLAARIDRLPPEDIYPTARVISHLKTGGITALAALLGAIAAGASRSTCLALRHFGRSVGMCLQMYNDLIELRRFAEGDERSDDLRNLRVTWPWVWASWKISRAELTALQQQAGYSVDDTHQLRKVAYRLLQGIGEQGHTRIESKLERGLAKLGKHVELSQSLRILLNKLRR